MTDPLKPADSDLRAAPYPPETSAKGWRFEIAMEKVRQSDTWSLTLLRGYEPKALLIWMWSVAWEQTPCGSFPNDEGLIAARLELPPKVWQKHRDILMRNWWLASDGRLYHPILTAQALEMLANRARGYLKFRAEVVERCGAGCWYCGASEAPTLDHVMPRSRGGADDPENLVPACKSCNSSKGAKTPEEWRA